MIDIAIISGPRRNHFPSYGAKRLSRWCADAGLRVGWYGGEDLTNMGVLPAETTGGVFYTEDAQKRTHRIQARAIVKIVSPLHFPVPFEGWYSPGLIPESTANQLMQESHLSWSPTTVILGTGNRAFRMGSEILSRKFCEKIVCLESVLPAGKISGWEVERLRFERLGGRVAYGVPRSLNQKSALTYELRIEDENGIRILETARVISVGPFQESKGFVEYPPGSLCFEWENVDAEEFTDDVEQNLIDEHRAVILANRIIRGLVDVDSGIRGKLDKAIWVSKQRLKELEGLPSRKFRFGFDGKWLNAATANEVKNFAGVPKNPAGKIKASIECIEPIGCRVCERHCPVNAIQIDRSVSTGKTMQFLIEDQCTGCGICLQACPSEVPIMIDLTKENETSIIVPYSGKQKLSEGSRVLLLNRRGESLAESRIGKVFLEGKTPLLKVEIAPHFLWDARSIRPAEGEQGSQVESEKFYSESGSRVEVQIQGEIRRVRDQISVSQALFETAMARPNDTLMCKDGACNLCQVEIDGTRKLACQSKIHAGMSIRFSRNQEVSSAVCPCENVSQNDIQNVFDNQSPQTIEGFMQTTPATRGRCHGLICRENTLCKAEACMGQKERFVDWSFPWKDWAIKPSSK